MAEHSQNTASLTVTCGPTTWSAMTPDFSDQEALLAAYDELLSGALDAPVEASIIRERRLLEKRLTSYRYAAEVEAIQLELESLQHQERASVEEVQALLERQKVAVAALTESIEEAAAASLE